MDALEPGETGSSSRGALGGLGTCRVAGIFLMFSSVRLLVEGSDIAMEEG